MAPVNNNPNARPAVPGNITNTTNASNGNTGVVPPIAAPAPAAPVAEPHQSIRERASDALDTELMRTARRDNKILNLSTDVGGIFSVDARLNVRALTEQNDTDPFRRASGKVWNQATLSAGVRANATAGVVDIASASKRMTSRVILPTDLATSDATLGKVFQSFRGNASEIGQNLAHPFDADAPFKTENVSKLPAGAAVSVKFNKSLAIGPQKSVSATAGSVGASASASLTETISRDFARTAYKLDGNKVYAEVVDTTGRAFGGEAKFSIGSQFDGVVGNAVERQIDRRAEIAGNIGASISKSRPFTIGGVFDLSKPDQAAAYQELMNANPYELMGRKDDVMQRLSSVGVGFGYEALKKATDKHAHLGVGKKDLITYSSVSTNEKGQLTVSEPDGSGTKTTTLAQSQYDGKLTGNIPMNLLGRNGNVMVRATGYKAEGDAEFTIGAGVSKSIDVKKVTPELISRARNMLNDMGIDTAEVKTDLAVGGKGHFDIEFAMNQPFFDSIAKLGPNREAKVLASFDANYKQMNGTLPPWSDQTTKPDGYPFKKPYVPADLFFAAKKELEEAKSPGNDEGNAASNAQNAYRIATHGRDLREDIASYELRGNVGKAIATASSDPSTWGKTITEIGKAKDGDFLVLAMMARDLGAPLVKFSAKANGISLEAEPDIGARNEDIQAKLKKVGLLTGTIWGDPA